MALVDDIRSGAVLAIKYGGGVATIYLSGGSQLRITGKDAFADALSDSSGDPIKVDKITVAEPPVETKKGKYRR